MLDCADENEDKLNAVGDKICFYWFFVNKINSKINMHVYYLGFSMSHILSAMSLKCKAELRGIQVQADLIIRELIVVPPLVQTSEHHDKDIFLMKRESKREVCHRSPSKEFAVL